MVEFYSHNFDNVDYPIRSVENLARGYAKNRKLIYLNIGDPVRVGMPTPKEIRGAACREILAGRNAYAPSNGCDEGRKAVARFYERRGIDVSHEDVYLTSGVSEAIHLIYLSLFNRGDCISLPRPYYPLYENLARLYSVRVRFYELDENGYPDLNSLSRSIVSKTKAVVLINPNNPMGSNLTKKMLEEVKQTVLSKNTLLISDEIYSEITYDGNMNYAQAGSEDERVITLSGISKSYLVPGWRTGWVVFGRDRSLSKLRKNFEKSLQLRLSAPAPFQYALEDILSNEKFLSTYVDRLKKNAMIVQKYVNETPALSLNKISAAYYAFIKMNWRGRSTSFAIDLIKKQGVVTVPGVGFGKEGYFRVVFAGDVKVVEEAMDRIVDEANKHGK